MPRRLLLLVATLALASALLYTTRLGFSPAYLMHDESQFALQAASIASSGRDLAGRFLPIFFAEPEFPAGRDPASIYLTAAALVWLPVSEANVRLPTAALGVLNIVLMFVLARRLFGRDWMALSAAVLLALTPAHFIRSRLLLSPQGSIPFILAWLICLAAFSERAEPRRLAIAAAWLGLGLYTYLACVVMMPVYLLLTMIVGYRALGPRAAGIAVIAFAIPVIPMAIWYLTHPERVTQVVGAYELAKSAESAPSFDSGLLAVRAKLGLFWRFFSPEYLFVSGDTSLINSTRLAGLFPTSFAVLLPLGLWQLMRARREIGLVVLAGLVTAPLASIVSGAIEMNRVLFVIPFAVLTAVYGVEWLVATRARAWQALAVVLLLAVPWQFVGFYQDYMGRYRVTASSWLGGNTRDAMTAAVERQAVGTTAPVYVSRDIPFAQRYWRFFALAAGRADLIERAEFYGPEQPSMAATGSELLCPLPSEGCRTLLASGSGWTLVKTITELDGTPSFALLERQ